MHVWASFSVTGQVEIELVADGPAPNEGHYLLARC